MLGLRKKCPSDSTSTGTGVGVGLFFKNIFVCDHETSIILNTSIFPTHMRSDRNLFSNIFLYLAN